MQATETFKEAMKKRVGLNVFRAKNRDIVAHDMMNFLIPYGGAVRLCCLSRVETKSRHYCGPFYPR